MQAHAIGICQIDSCRVGGVNEVLSILLMAAKYNIPVFEYSAKKVKQAITGNGNADKTQIQYMVKQIFKLKILPQPLDASDAIGIALCHYNQLKIKEL